MAWTSQQPSRNTSYWDRCEPGGGRPFIGQERQLVGQERQLVGSPLPVWGSGERVTITGLPLGWR